MTTYEPGTVVKILTGCNEGRIGYLTAKTGESQMLPVALPDGEEENGLGVLAYGPSSVRPLVTLDVAGDRGPLDLRTYVDGLRSNADYLDADNRYGAELLRDIAKQVEAQISRPKPEEPTGLGAVVEDASQVEYIHLGSGLWAYGTTDGPSGGFAYADINAVRVLSRGVPA